MLYIHLVPSSPAFTAAIITVSTAGAKGEREDRSGKLLSEGLKGMGIEVRYGEIIPDDLLTIQRQTLRFCDHEPVSLLVFTGGTGPTHDDVTPEAVSPLLDRRYDGIESTLHEAGRAATERAPISRLLVGARGSTLVVALPGSPAAVSQALITVRPFLSHLLALIAGQRDPH